MSNSSKKPTVPPMLSLFTKSARASDSAWACLPSSTTAVQASARYSVCVAQYCVNMASASPTLHLEAEIVEKT